METYLTEQEIKKMTVQEIKERINNNEKIIKRLENFIKKLDERKN